MVVSVRHQLRPRFDPGKDPRYPFTGGWVDLRAGLDTEARGKILCFYRRSNSSRPACSETLFWLPPYKKSYSASIVRRLSPLHWQRNIFSQASCCSFTRYEINHLIINCTLFGTSISTDDFRILQQQALVSLPVQKFEERPCWYYWYQLVLW
jgi:hypothetical protein